MMKFMNDKLYTRQDVARQISECIMTHKWKVISITGTSCVGKSTFTGMITDELKEKNISFQIIGVDSYLKKEYRAETKLWIGSEPHLMPKHFDWKKLNGDIEQLKSGKDVQKQVYIRGLGWNNEITYHDADVLILEGLFLDSAEAAEVMEYDLLVTLTAEDEMIRQTRMERDDYYREHFENFKRTREETLIEIEQTLKAGKSYERKPENWNCLNLEIQKDYRVKVERTELD